MRARVLALAMAVVMTGCGGDDGTETPAGPGATSTSPSPTPSGPELDQRTAQEQHLATAGPDLATVPAGAGVSGRPITAFDLTASDSDTPCSRLQFSAEGLPERLAVTNDGDCTATVSGTIRAPEGGYVVTYRVADDSGASDVSVSVFTVRREP